MFYPFVLLIDDTEVDNFISRSVIKQAQFSDHILDFEAAQPALNYLDSIKNDTEKIPDIIFLDINMPIMDGFMFLEKYGALPNSILQKVKIVMLSSSPNRDDVEKSNTNRYVIKFINKPLTKEKLENIFLQD